ncbi:MAG: hypothetical protein ACK5MA_11255, partial [Parachlamydiaceae bacterium]
ATTHDTEAALMQGFIREGYLTKASYPPGDVQVIKRGMYALEQTAVSDIGALADIDEQGRIIQAKPTIDKTQHKQSTLVQEGILAFCHALGQYTQNNPWNSHSDALNSQLRSIFVRAAGFLTKEEATAFEKWSHDHISLKDSSRHDLGSNAYYEKHIQDMLPLNAFEDWGMTWPAAYAAKKGEALARTALGARSETLPPECFQSIDSLPIKIYIDHGKGFSSKPTHLIHVSSNAQRKFYLFHKLTSMKKPLRKVKLELDCPNAYIKIESLQFTARFTNSPDTEIYTHSLEQKNPFLTKEDPLTLTHPFDSSHIYQLHVNLCFATLRL